VTTLRALASELDISAAALLGGPDEDAEWQ